MAAFTMSLGIMAAQDLESAVNTYNKGAEALTLGNKEEAVQYFEEALKTATALGADGEEVANNCKSAIPSTILSIGKELYNAKDFDGAKAKFQEAAAKAAEYGNSEVANDASDLLSTIDLQKNLYVASEAFKAKDFGAALKAYKEVVAADSTNGVAALRVGQILSGSNIEEAETYLLKAANNGQKENAYSILSSGYLKQAAASLKAQQFSKAIDYAAKANEYKENAQAYLVLGQANQKAGNNADAISYFEKYLEQAPTAKNANAITFTVAALYQQAGNKAKAVENYKKVASDPKFGTQAQTQINALNK